MFSREILLKNKVPRMLLKRKDTLFREDEKAVNLYFLTEGEIKIYNTDSEGKEFLIEKVSHFKFLGEPPFLLGERYPANSVIISDTAEIFRFSNEHFKQFMTENPDMLLKFTNEIARKAYSKTMKLKSIVHQNPQERILNFLKNHKRSNNLELTEKCIIEVTRKEMANSTGLAIETVIRTVKKMERDQKIELINHKILF
ncbi:Crp/Fnr family transcriptional regulator [Chryseobacterium koreense]|uniref:Crp/Fnr family transcriptional regulator n=1 Tax=Chryseobacterium koreense TaxID=232216 RepID=UPI0026E96B03|nr:Crp/Fnr family transcriptional regulator [Chryseobacterium koreense]